MPDSILETAARRRRSVFYLKTDMPAPAAQQIALEDITRIANHFSPGAAVQEITGIGTWHSLYRAGEFLIRANRLTAPAVEFLIDSWIYDLLQDRLPLAKVIEVNLTRTACPFDYEVVRFVPGSNLRALEDPETQQLDGKMLRGVGALAAAVHGVKGSGFGLLDIAKSTRDNRPAGLLTHWPDYVLLNLESHVTTCAAIGAIHRREVDEIEALFREAEPVLERFREPALLHGDLSNHNIMADGGEITALLDWEDAMCGDPLFDLAYWGTSVREWMVEEMVEGYRDAGGALTDDWRVLYWLYFLRIALSKTVHRHHFEIADHPGRPPASRRIQTALRELALQTQ